MRTEIPLTMKTFHIIDYIIFILTLLISSAIGIFYAWKDKKCQNTTDFLLGGRKMPLFPVALSLMASFLSSVSVLGVPTEIFYNGAIYWVGAFSAFLFIPFTVHFILPVLYNAGLSSAFEVRFLLRKIFSKFSYSLHDLCCVGYIFIEKKRALSLSCYVVPSFIKKNDFYLSSILSGFILPRCMLLNFC